MSGSFVVEILMLITLPQEIKKMEQNLHDSETGITTVNIQ